MQQREPVAGRPGFPDVYGVPSDLEGMLDWTWAEERLTRARNYWVVSVRPDGSPHSAPVWALWRDGALVFSTAPASRKGRNLAHDPRVVINLESGDEVVILEGEAETAAFDESLADAYEAKYGYRPTGGRGWFALRPRVAYAWLESEYPRSATRFSFKQ